MSATVVAATEGGETTILEDPASDVPALSGFDIVSLTAREDAEGLHLTLHLAGSIPPPAGKTDYKVFWRTAAEAYRNVGASLRDDGGIECDRAPDCEIDLANAQVRYHIPYDLSWSLGCALFSCSSGAFFPTPELREFAVEVWQVDTGGDICYDRAPDEAKPTACPGRDGTRAGSYTIHPPGPTTQPYGARIEATPSEWYPQGTTFWIDVEIKNTGDEAVKRLEFDPEARELDPKGPVFNLEPGGSVFVSFPLVHAEPTEGVLFASSLTAPPGATTEAELSALFAPATDQMASLTLRAPSILVRAFEASYIEVDLPGLRPQVQTAWTEATYELTGVVASLDVETDRTGWLGLWLDQGAARTHARQQTQIRAEAGGQIGNGDVGEEDERHSFLARVEGPQLALDSDGDWRVEGTIKLKLSGPDLILNANENTSRLVTGWETREARPGEVHIRWAVITASGATLELGLPDGAHALTRAAHTTWEGRARLDEASGAIAVGRDDVTFDRETAYLSGRMQATLLPTIEAQVPRLQAQLTGDLNEAAISSANLRTHDRAPVWPWLLAIGIAVAAGGGAVLLKRSSARPHPQVVVPSEQPLISAEECVGLADLAAEAEDFRTALAWIRRAKHFAPTSARILLDEGFFLESLGEQDAAVATYEAASRLQPESGEADLYLARLRLKSGAHASDIEGFLVRALEKSPLLLLEVEDDDSWGPVLKRPAVVSAIRKAHAELD